MNEAKHTSGPWRATKKGASVLAGSSIVAFVPDYTEDAAGRIANARLIAAAPDLLAALQALMSDLHWSRDAGYTIGPLADIPGGRLEMARAAIAKATVTEP